MPSRLSESGRFPSSTPAQEAEVEISVEEAAGLKAVIVRGEIDFSTAARLDDALDKTRAEPLDLLIDLCRVDFLDCAGVHRLAAADAAQASKGRAFAIACNPSGEVSRLFETLAASGLELPVYRSRAEALLAALRAPAQTPAAKP
jgi:anti-anti-sigma factor